MQSEKRKLIKFSNYSLCVTLPKWVIRELKWDKGDLVNMDVDTEAGVIHISKGKGIAKKTVAKEPKKDKGLRW